MKQLGILDMIQLAAGFAMAGPMFFIGLEFLRRGELLGVGFLVIGGFALYFPTYLVNQVGGPRTWIRRRIGSSGTDSDEEEQNTSSNSGLLARLRRR